MDRITIFTQLSMDEFRNLDLDRSQRLIDTSYDQFNSFCEFIKRESRPGGSLENIVESVSCDMSKDTIEFHTNLADGSVQTIHFEKE